MCLSIRPRPRAHCFSFVQTTHFWKSPTGSFHQDFTLGFARTVSRRSANLKCARLSAPVQGPTVSVSYKLGTFGKPRPVALTGTLF